MKAKKVHNFFPNGPCRTNQEIVNTVYVILGLSPTDWVTAKHVSFLNSIPDRIDQHLNPRKCILNMSGRCDRHFLYLNKIEVYRCLCNHCYHASLDLV